MIKRISAFVLMAIIFVVLASPSNAYVLNGRKLDKSKQMTYVAHSGFSDTTFTHMNNALYKWYQATGYNMMKRDPNQRHNSTNFNATDQNGKYVSNDGLNYIYKVSVISASYVALNRSYYSVSTGIVVESDINFNASCDFASIISERSFSPSVLRTHGRMLFHSI